MTDEEVIERNGYHQLGDLVVSHAWSDVLLELLAEQLAKLRAVADAG